MTVRLFICIILFTFSAHARGEKSEVSAFLDRINPSQIYSDDKKLAEAFERELDWIKAAHEKRRNIPDPPTTKKFKSEQEGKAQSPESANHIHPPEFVEKVRSLVREDYQREGIEFDENVTRLEHLLHPHKMDPLKVIGYKSKPQPSGPSTSFDYLFTSLYILTDDGILTEAGILVAAAAEFWLYGVPRNSLESYEADSQQYLSRLGFINHDEYHRFLIISQLEHRLKAHRFGTNSQLSPLPTRVRNLLSNLKLDKQLIDDIFAFVHERYWDDLDNHFFKKDSFLETPWGYELYTYFFEVPVNRALFSITTHEDRKTMILYALMDLFTQKQSRQFKEKEYCHCLSPHLLFWCCREIPSIIRDIKFTSLGFPDWKSQGRRHFLKSLSLVSPHPLATSDDNTHFKIAVLLLKAFSACNDTTEAEMLLESLEKTSTTKPITSLTRFVTPDTLAPMKGGVLGYFFQSLALLDMTQSSDDDTCFKAAGLVAKAFNICNDALEGEMLLESLQNVYKFMPITNLTRLLTPTSFASIKGDVLGYFFRSLALLDMTQTADVLRDSAEILAHVFRWCDYPHCPNIYRILRTSGGPSRLAMLLDMRSNPEVVNWLAQNSPESGAPEFLNFLNNKQSISIESYILGRGGRLISEYCCSSLKYAIENGDLFRVKFLLLPLKVPVNKVDSCGNSPLHHAAVRRHREKTKELIELLMQQGGDLYLEGERRLTPLSRAIERGNLEFIEAIRPFMEEAPSPSNQAGQFTLSSMRFDLLTYSQGRILEFLTAQNCHNDVRKASFRGKTTPEIIEIWGRLPNVTSLDVSYNSFDASAVGEILSCPLSRTITSLALSLNNIEGAVCQHFSLLTNLHSLNLSQNKLGDAGCQYLSPLTGLRKLKLSHNNIGDEGCQHLSPLTNLQSLGLFDNNIGDTGCQHLSPLTALRELNLGHNNNIGGVVCQYVSTLTNLQLLDLSHNKIGDVDCRYLFPLTALQTLYLEQNQIGDAACQRITGTLTGIKTIVLSYQKEVPAA